MTQPLNPEQLEELRQFNTPTISNAIEAFNVRSRAVGFMTPNIRCLFPERGRMVAYTATGRVIASEPRRAGEKALGRATWQTIRPVARRGWGRPCLKCPPGQRPDGPERTYAATVVPDVRGPCGRRVRDSWGQGRSSRRLGSATRWGIRSRTPRP